MKYFAYGSNMSLARLKERVPSAVRVGTFSLGRHSLRFHKSSKDGSGKCDAFQTSNPKDSVIGALFEIDKREKKALDKAEGLGYGYEEKIVEVQSSTGELVEATTYYATRINSSLKPYSWYLYHVIVGARETNVPEAYFNYIQAFESIEDTNTKRDSAQRAIYDSSNE